MAIEIGIWTASILVLIALMALTGRLSKRRWLGLLINEYSRASISRLQFVLWATLFLSSAFTFIGFNLSRGNGWESFALDVPIAFWIVLVTSMGSYFGDRLVARLKSQQTIPSSIESGLLQDLRNGGSSSGFDEVSAIGYVIKLPRPELARSSDLFTGDDLGNAEAISLGKVQLFFFTTVLILAYGVAIADRLLVSTGMLTFPSLDVSIAALLVFSHLGFIGTQAVSHLPSELRDVAEFSLPDGESVLVEVRKPQDRILGIGRRHPMPRQADESFIAAVAQVRPAVDALTTELATLKSSPVETKVQFGIKLNAQAGAFIASAGAEANFSVTLTWASDNARTSQTMGKSEA